MSDNKKPGIIATILETIADMVWFLFFAVVFIVIIFLIPNWDWTKKTFNQGVQTINDRSISTIEGAVDSCETKDSGFVVLFKDGRKFTFSNIPAKPLNKDKYYVISYNGKNEFVAIQEKP